MPRKCVCVALVAIFALAGSRSAQAQVTVDVTKVNWDQFVHHKVSEPRLIAAWLSGYWARDIEQFGRRAMALSICHWPNRSVPPAPERGRGSC